MMGFKAFHSAQATIAGIEAADMIRKGQLAGCSVRYRRYFCVSKPSSGRWLHEAEFWEPPVQNIHQLEAALHREWQQLSQLDIRCLTGGMRRRVEAVIEVRGVTPGTEL
jgi:hypothetical protein